MENKSLLFGIGLTLLANLFFALSGTCVRALPENFPVVEIVFFQNFICLLLVIPYCLKRGTLNFQLTNLPTHFIRDIAGVLSFLTYFWAIQKLGLVDATILSYMTPFYVPFVWKLWTKDRIEKDVWWMVVIGFIGISVILKPKNLFQISSLIGILSAIFSAFAVVALKNLNRKGESLSRTLLYFFIVGSVLSFLFAFPSWQTPTWHQLFLLISLGLLSIFAQIFLTTAYRYGTASFLSPLSYSTIVFTGLFSWFFFNQIPSWNMLIGTLLIIGGGTLSYILRIHPTDLEEVFKRQNNSKKWWQFWKKIPKI